MRCRPSTFVEGRCERHLFDRAVDLCGRCASEFCADCLVYSFGPKKPPFCLPCAVAASGVRQGAGFKPKADRKEAKAFARKREEFLARREHSTTVKAPVVMDDSWLDRIDEPSTRPIPGVIPPNVASA